MSGSNALIGGFGLDRAPEPKLAEEARRAYGSTRAPFSGVVVHIAMKPEELAKTQAAADEAWLAYGDD